MLQIYVIIRLTLQCIFLWLIIIKCSISLSYCILFRHFPYSNVYTYTKIFVRYTQTLLSSCRLYSTSNVQYWPTTSNHSYPKKCLVANMLMKSTETLRNLFFNLITISRSSLLITVQIHLDLLYHSYAYN